MELGEATQQKVQPRLGIPNTQTAKKNIRTIELTGERQSVDDKG